MLRRQCVPSVRWRLSPKALLVPTLSPYACAFRLHQGSTAFVSLPLIAPGKNLRDKLKFRAGLFLPQDRRSPASHLSKGTADRRAIQSGPERRDYGCNGLTGSPRHHPRSIERAIIVFRNPRNPPLRLRSICLSTGARCRCRAALRRWARSTDRAAAARCSRCRAAAWRLGFASSTFPLVAFQPVRRGHQGRER